MYIIQSVSLFSKERGIGMYGKVAIPARDQLNRGKNVFSLCPFAPENFLVSQDGVLPSRPASACLFSTLKLYLVLTLPTGFLPLSATTASLSVYILDYICCVYDFIGAL